MLHAANIEQKSREGVEKSREFQREADRNQGWVQRSIWQGAHRSNPVERKGYNKNYYVFLAFLLIAPSAREEERERERPVEILPLHSPFLG